MIAKVKKKRRKRKLKREEWLTPELKSFHNSFMEGDSIFARRMKEVEEVVKNGKSSRNS